MRPSCSAARTGADPVPYTFASRRSLVTTSGVKRVFSSVAAPWCFGSFHSSLKSDGGRVDAGGACANADAAQRVQQTNSMFRMRTLYSPDAFPCVGTVL